jgi:hypothetical protein
MRVPFAKTGSRLLAPLTLTVLAALVLAGCSKETSGGDTVAVQGDVPIAYAKRNVNLSANPTDGAPFAAGGDLMVREKSSASAPEYNVTANITQGNGDVSDPEVSYDGKKIVFALRCPTSNTSQIAGVAACTGRWNIWEYDFSAGTLANGTLRRITSSTQDDDVDPYYLPANRGFVFASNRQTKSRINQALGVTYYALDEYERERVLNLHTMDRDGGSITQISVNQSHDRNPVVKSNGEIMFSRWEHVGPRNRFAIFRSKPDGTDMFVFYGAQSPGNSFLHPREMDPNGPYRGYVASSLMALSGTNEGGALMFIDAANYSEHNTPATPAVSAQGGQREATTESINQGRGVSRNGRFTAPYPLWDGTNRVLVGFAPCQVSRNGVVVPCATLTDAEIARLNDRQRLLADQQADPLQNNVPPVYAIYMFNPANQTMLIVAAPPTGFMYTDPIALQPRQEPNSIDPTNVDATLAAQNLGLVEVRSIYDTDGLDRMGESMLTASDMPGCSVGIAKRAPEDHLDTRAQVADLRRMKDPADAAYRCAPAYFVRATRSIPPPASMMGLGSAIGETEFEQQQILGYAPIEPDGSFKLLVPADTAIGLAVVDAKGRGIQTHLNWIQVRPGERRTCDGCHSPRRGASLNSGAVVNTLPAALNPTLATQHLTGETLASLRTRLNPAALNLQADMNFVDVWADTSRAGVTARPSVLVRYTGNTNAADDLATAVPVNGVINFPEHVAPIFTRNRGANTCTNCHNDPARLDLRDTVSGTGHLTSYTELMLGDPVIDQATGQPVVVIRDGVPEIERGASLVETMAGNATGMARASRLTEILFGETLKASAAARTAFPGPAAGGPDHSTMLNAAEKRVISEWMDLGGQYYNNPFTTGANVRSINGLSRATFDSTIFPILRTTCASGCHQAIGSDPTVPVGSNFSNNRFVLTGNPEGDFGVTLAMISNACAPTSNALLVRPSTAPHPAAGTAAVLPAGSANYNAIANWIQGGC